MEGKLKDPYKILGIPHTATSEEIEAAYQRMRHLYHPDYNQEPFAAKVYALASDAYELLKNPAYNSSFFAAEDKDDEEQAREGLSRYSANKKLQQKMLYARRVSIPLFSGLSILMVNSTLTVSITQMCIIDILVCCAGILMGSVFWRMLWYVLNTSERALYDIAYKISESFNGINLTNVFVE